MGDDRLAVVWAFTTLTPAGKRVAERVSRGEQPAVTDELFVEIREEWQAAGRPILHPHVHRDAVTFADGTTVIGARFLVDDPYTRDEPPTFGLYLDEHWAPPWDHAHLPWADYGVPDAAELRTALEVLLDRARRGERVEVGCLGGHGRTGTALACLAVMTGTAPGEAVAWVRATYCEKAIETDEQLAFVAAFGQAPSSELVLREERLDGPAGSRLLGAFAGEIALRYPGWSPDVGPSAAAEEFVAPSGRFLVGYVDTLPVACGGIKRLDDSVGEVKRLYVVPEARGQGVARRLLRSLEDAGIELGFHAVRLDTGNQQPDALALFRSSGYFEIPDYNDNPYAAYWFEKALA